MSAASEGFAVGGFDHEAYMQLKLDEVKSIRDSEFLLTGEDFEMLKYAVTLARRCFDRDEHFEVVEKPVAEVVGKMRRQWLESPEGISIINKQRKLLGLEPLDRTGGEDGKG